MTNGSYFVRMSDMEASEMLRQLASDDMRTIAGEVAWLVRREYERRQQPVTAAAEAVGAESQAGGGK